ncbi:hypothetical protein L210DRAFT_3500704 [Boletus edulis BED1]|uniref:Uncharacterized protein n=1 Tax=Boletus edulis BED1 TaxID=1328754 RepID=A0AAD4C568_BOLED|nr:hypothetical protein L210DRAFT_3500704 [Boletus edulis BED1]
MAKDPLKGPSKHALWRTIQCIVCAAQNLECKLRKLDDVLCDEVEAAIDHAVPSSPLDINIVMTNASNFDDVVHMTFTERLLGVLALDGGLGLTLLGLFKADVAQWVEAQWYLLVNPQKIRNYPISLIVAQQWESLICLLGWNTVYSEVTRNLEDDKTRNVVSNKYQLSRDMTQIKNRGWLFYNRMVLLVPNVGADSKNTHGVALNSSLSLVNPSMVGTPAFQSNDLPLFDATQNFADIDVDKLLQVTTAHFQILNASKCKSRAHTPAMSLSYRTSCCTSSVGASKWNHVSQAKFSMANAAPLNGMVDVLQTEPSIEHCDPPNIVCEASAMLNNDNHFFTAKIHGKLAYSFIKDKDLCQVYIELTDSEL